MPVSDVYNYLEMNRIAEGLEHVAEYILLDFTPHYGDWNNFVAHGNFTVTELAKLCHDHNIMLGSRFNKIEVAEVMSIIQPRALNIAGAAESKTGEKDFAELESVFESLR